ncbi:YhgE/Pip family protein [Metabacillus sp. HB246100]
MEKRSVFLSEWKSILRNKKVLIPILAVIFVPILYAGMFLWAFWDPYEKLADLPVAIVNEDDGSTYEGRQLELGNDLVENLKENEQFQFEFVSKEEGYEGLSDETYYMVIEIPENFSQNATTLLEDEPQKLHLTYVPNEGYNFLSAQIGETAVKEIKSAVSKEVTATYAESIFEKVTEMADGFKQASDGAGELDEGAQKLKDGSSSLQENLETFALKSVEFEEGMSQAQSGSVELNDGAKELADGVGQLSDASHQLYNASKEVRNGAQELQGGINQVDSGLKELTKKIPQLVDGTEQVNEGIKAFQAQVPPQLAAGIQESLNGATASMASGLDELESQLSAQMSAALAEGIYTQQTEQVTSMLTFLQESHVDPAVIQQLQQQLGGTTKEDLQAELKKELAGGLNQGFSQYKSAVTEELASSGSQLESEIQKAIDPSLNQLTSGLATIIESEEALQNGVTELADGSSQVSEGASELANGQIEYTKQFATFDEKLSEANAGGAQFVSGVNELNAGLNELTDGSSQLRDGASQLAEGSTELASGTGELTDGTSELYAKLGDAATEANSVNADDKTFDMMGEPVDVSKEEINRVPNYGTGFAPYFLSLGLFVGALLISIVYKLKEPSIEPRNGLTWFFGKFGVIGIVGVIQALVADAILLMGLGLEVTSVPLFMLLSIIISITFMTLVQLLVTTLGDPGRFIAIIILILQLTTSAGTFPLELIPSALQPISALLPMTYTVAGLKAVVSSGDLSVIWHNIWILLSYTAVFMILTATYLIIKHKQRHASEEVVACA